MKFTPLIIALLFLGGIGIGMAIDDLLDKPITIDCCQGSGITKDLTENLCSHEYGGDTGRLVNSDFVNGAASLYEGMSGLPQGLMTKSGKVSWALMASILKNVDTVRDPYIYFRFGITEVMPGQQGLGIFVGNNQHAASCDNKAKYITPAKTGFCPNNCPVFQ